MVLDEMRVPIVLAPRGGGPSTPELAAAVCDAGGLGFLAANYLTPTRSASGCARSRRAVRRQRLRSVSTGTEKCTAFRKRIVRQGGGPCPASRFSAHPLPDRAKKRGREPNATDSKELIIRRARVRTAPGPSSVRCAERGRQRQAAVPDG